jgi:hypothetical protein
MKLSGNSMKDDLIALWKIQSDIQEERATTGIASAERRVRELLENTQEFVARYSPDSYTVSLGSGSDVSVSFTWASKRKPAPRFLTQV